jgi:polyhydroxybutyrate depolymerase
MKSEALPLVLLLTSLGALACSAQSDGQQQNQPLNTAGTTAAGGAPTGVAPVGGEGGMTTVDPGPAGGMGGDSTMPAMGGMGGSDASGGASMGGAGGQGGITLTGPSMGCGQDHGDEPRGAYTDHTISITGLTAEQMADGQAEREYFVYLPQGFDGNQPYPVVFYGPGCGASGVEGTPLTGSLGQDAILVFLLQHNSCFSTGDNPEQRSPELNYFEQVLAEIQANYCTDLGRVFVSGYSSGAWLSNLLACYHGDKIRGIGTAAGGFRPPVAECVGQVAAIMHAGTMDDANPISRLDDNGVEYGSIAGRDRLIEVNGCTPGMSEPWDAMYSDCVVFKDGCEANPVVWCEENTGHSNGGQVSASGFWKFWSSLP